MAMEPLRKGAQRVEETHVSSGALVRSYLDLINLVPRWVWLTAAVATLSVSSTAVLLQMRRPFTYEGPRSWRTVRWWREPLEFNAVYVLPQIQGNINAIAVVPGSRRIWIAGDIGLLAFSDDDGRNWTLLEYDSASGAFHIPTAMNPPVTQEAASAVTAWPGPLAPFYVVHAGAPVEQAKKPSAQRKESPKQTPAQQSVSQNGPYTKQVGPRVLLNPPALHFPVAAIGMSATMNVTLTNSGDSPLGVTDIHIEGQNPRDFRLMGSGCVGDLPPGKSCRININFRPTAPGPLAANLVISDNGPGSPQTVTLSGGGGAVAPGASTGGTTGPSRPQPPSGPTSTVPPDLMALQFLTSRTGQILASDGSEYRSSNGGELWQRRGRTPGSLFLGGKQLKINLQGSAGSAIESEGGYSMVADAQHAFWAKPGSQLQATSDGGKNWSAVAPSDLKLSVEALWFADAQYGWAVGSGQGRGAIAKTDDGARHWRDQYSDARNRLHSIAFQPDAVDGWAAGENGAVLRTADGGAHWLVVTRGAALGVATAPPSSPWRLMPPWYYLALLLSFQLAALALRVPPDVGPAEESIAGLAVSDRPLQPGEPDALNLKSIALGLSRFLRNEHTLPPLTIAINGQWGTGKSSLMNLLREDLASYGFRPVWFNAWHHQKEEHLLAALLQVVRLEAVPPWWALSGMGFRARLLGHHARRYWVTALLVLAFVAFFAGLEWAHHQGHPSDALYLSLPNLLKLRFLTNPQGQADVPRFGLLVSLLSALSALWKGLTAFGVTPASLLTTVTPGKRVKDLDAQISFREKFAVEFQDVTRALGQKRPMVIFIDDLDRCRPDNIGDLLEAVNFIVSLGECFIVMGLARETVERSVGLCFKEVAQEMSDLRPDPNEPNPQQAVEELSKKKRIEFARHYLDKLINIEVPVPAPKPEQERRLFVPEPLPEPSAREKRLRWAGEVAEKALVATLSVLLLVGGYRVGRDSADPLEKLFGSEQATPRAQQQPAQVQAQAGATTAATAGATNQPVTGAASNVPATGTKVTAATQRAKQLQPPKIEGGSPARPQRWWIINWWPFYLAVAGLIVVIRRVLTERPELVVKDSPIFTQALDIWYRLVTAPPRNTPRAAKRFLNRVRYLAMRQRPQWEIPSLWQRALAPTSDGAHPAAAHTADAQGDQRIPESLLVALAAIHQFAPEMIERTESPFGEAPSVSGAKFAEFLLKGRSPDFADDFSLLAEAATKHEAAFHNWTEGEFYRFRYLEMCGEVTVR
jgi:photosystem II stability/assembly factor-like uncharacterized protein